MRRTQIYVDEKQWARLEKAAARTRRTKSDLIRQAIDIYLSGPESRSHLAAEREAAFGVWTERADLGPTDAYVRQLRRGSRLERLFK